MSQVDIEQQVSTIYNLIVGTVTEMKAKDFLGCLVKIMEAAESIPGLIGADKKKIVKQVLTLLVNKITFPIAQEKEFVLSIINGPLIDYIIDEIVTLTKTGCRINIEQLVKSKCSSCSCSSCKCILM